MNSNFARSLSLLRQERKISQRQAARDMGISQALLSHYENGVREPGLAFVVKACDYYNVSADYLLGRSMNRDGVVITTGELTDALEEKDNVMRGSIMAALNRKLILNSVSLLFELLAKVGDRAAIQAASDYLGNAVYRLFRHLQSRDTRASEEFFSLPGHDFLGGGTNVDAALAELDYIDALEQCVREKRPFPDTTYDGLAKEHPATYQSLLQVTQNTGSRMEQTMQSRVCRHAASNR